MEYTPELSNAYAAILKIVRIKGGLGMKILIGVIVLLIFYTVVLLLGFIAGVIATAQMRNYMKEDNNNER